MTVEQLYKELKFEMEMGRYDYDVMVSNSKDKVRHNIDEVYCNEIGTVHIEFNQEHEHY